MKHFSIFVALGLAAVSVAAQAGEQAVLKTSERHQQDRRLIQLRYGIPPRQCRIECWSLLFIACCSMATSIDDLLRYFVLVLLLIYTSLKSENDPGTWLTEYEILTLVQQRTPFMDITDHPPTLGVEQLIVADSKCIAYGIQLDGEEFIVDNFTRGPCRDILP